MPHPTYLRFQTPQRHRRLIDGDLRSLPPAPSGTLGSMYERIDENLAEL